MFRLTPQEMRLVVALSAALVVGYAVQLWRLQYASTPHTDMREQHHHGKN